MCRRFNKIMCTFIKILELTLMVKSLTCKKFEEPHSTVYSAGLPLQCFVEFLSDPVKHNIIVSLVTSRKLNNFFLNEYVILDNR